MEKTQAVAFKFLKEFNVTTFSNNSDIDTSSSQLVKVLSTALGLKESELNPYSIQSLPDPYNLTEDFFQSIGQAHLIAQVQQRTVELQKESSKLHALFRDAFELISSNCGVYKWLPSGYYYKSSELSQLNEWTTDTFKYAKW